MTSAIKPFRIDVSDDILADLKSRLARTRWPEAELVDDWSQGAPLKWIQEICAYWADGYDWRAREAKLNRLEQFTQSAPGPFVGSGDTGTGNCQNPDDGVLGLSPGWGDVYRWQRPGQYVEFGGLAPGNG